MIPQKILLVSINFLEYHFFEQSNFEKHSFEYFFEGRLKNAPPSLHIHYGFIFIDEGGFGFLFVDQTANLQPDLSLHFFFNAIKNISPSIHTEYDRTSINKTSNPNYRLFFENPHNKCIVTHTHT